MITVDAPKYGLINTKPLGVVWAAFPDFYRPENTIMFDDLRRNFIMNPQNGMCVCVRACVYVGRWVWVGWLVDGCGWGVWLAKPLGVVWAAFPDFYRPDNTIMFDYLRRNFIMNPQNGTSGMRARVRTRVDLRVGRWL